ncbi:hypothetical protein HELRODRAFT_165189 [Helobdella robusta]|uniref:Uncharacterized protein n=1 Tax=Helobdella robusta TaxID=6412 RepID=T1EWE6_HELRO|nr:hypothetical protein HELRODRAFT_165189 [Helobdella robusta]ESN93033.1 hypothetical protein HELRODRAFT_165189 [Helobdella robusta]
MAYNDDDDDNDAGTRNCNYDDDGDDVDNKRCGGDDGDQHGGGGVQDYDVTAGKKRNLPRIFLHFDFRRGMNGLNRKSFVKKIVRKSKTVKERVKHRVSSWRRDHVVKKPTMTSSKATNMIGGWSYMSYWSYDYS